MRFKTFIYYLNSVLAILVGAYLSTAPPTEPILTFLMRVGHGLIFFGASIIIGNSIGFLTKRRRMTSLSSFFAQEVGKVHSPPWLLKKDSGQVIITTNPRFSLIIIIGSITCYSILLYIILPGLGDIIAGTIDISLGNILLLIIFTSLLAALFIIINLVLIFRRMEKLIDKQREVIRISKGYKREFNQFPQFETVKDILELPLVNLNVSQIELKGYYQIQVPMEGARGDLESYKSWIFDDFFLLIQSRDEKFIKELDSELKHFINK